MNIINEKHSFCRVPKTKIAQTYKSIKVIQARAMPIANNISLKIDASSMFILRKNQKNQSQITESFFQDTFYEPRQRVLKPLRTFPSVESKKPPLLDKIAILLPKQPSLEILHQNTYKKIKFKSRFPLIEKEKNIHELSTEESLTVHQLNPDLVRNLFLFSEKQMPNFKTQNLQTPFNKQQFSIRKNVVIPNNPPKKVVFKLEKLPKRLLINKKNEKMMNKDEEKNLLIRGESSFFLKEENSELVDEFVNYVRKSKDLSPC